MTPLLITTAVAFALGIGFDRLLLAERWRRARMNERVWRESVRDLLS